MYDRFFEEMEIDSETGLKNCNGKNFRFATMPYIGNCYVDAHPRILFVGMDIGQDEMFLINKENGTNHKLLQDFEMRQSAFCGSSLSEKNPHIAGTYAAALYFLRDMNDVSSNAAKIILDSCKPFQAALKHLYGLPEDVLEYISLTNFYKFVGEGQKGRSNRIGRIFYKECYELLQKEVDIFDPEIVVLQSVGFRYGNLAEMLAKEGRKIFIAPHPSYRGSRVLKEYLQALTPSPFELIV